MGDLLALAVLLAWMWREREHTRERRALVERLTGVSLDPELPCDPEPPRSYGDAAEWEIEQERERSEG